MTQMIVGDLLIDIKIDYFVFIRMSPWWIKSRIFQPLILIVN